MIEWFRLDVDFAENKKVAACPIAARWFHLAAICYCARNLTDGHVDARAVKVVAAICETPARRCTEALVKAGLWGHDVEGDGFWINDYLKYQPAGVDVKELGDKRREAGRLGGLASGQARRKASARASASAKRKQSVRSTVQNKTRAPKALPLKANPKAVTELDHPAPTDSERTALGLVINDSLQEAS